MTNPQIQANAMEIDVLNEVCAKADAARIAQAQLAQTNTQRKNELLNVIADALDSEKLPQPTPSICRKLLNMVWTQASLTDSNSTCPESTQPHKAYAT